MDYMQGRGNPIAKPAILASLGYPNPRRIILRIPIHHI